jgi:hypothetical protein
VKALRAEARQLKEALAEATLHPMTQGKIERRLLLY